MNKKISIIVPVYNVELYLDRCIQSILNQTYKNLEIILIDDGSTDSSGYMCDKYANEDNRVIVIHKRNGGLASARNIGVKRATGDYIAFIDSDDWVSLDIYEYMINLLINTSSDVVQCSFLPTSKPVIIKQSNEKIKVYNNKDILQFYLEYSTKTGSYSVWKFLYNIKLIKNIYFREGKINEDIDYNYKVLNNAKRLTVSNQIKYFYYQSGNSLSTGGFKKRDFDLYEASSELLKLTKNESYKDIKFLGKVKYSRTAFSLLCKITYYGISDSSINEKQLLNNLLEEHKKNYRILLKAPIGLLRKILVILFVIDYKSADVLVKFFKSLIHK